MPAALPLAPPLCSPRRAMPSPPSSSKKPKRVLGKASWLGSRTSRRVLEWMFVVGLAASTFALSEVIAKRQAEAEVRIRLDRFRRDLVKAIEHKVEVLEWLKTQLETTKVDLTLEEFRDFARRALVRHPELYALEWFPLVTTSQRQQFELALSTETSKYEIREPAAQAAMIRAQDRAFHLPLAYVEPYNPWVVGLDLAHRPKQLELLIKSFESESPVLAPRDEVQERTGGPRAISVFLPVSAAKWRREPELPLNKGLVAALFRVDKVVEGVLEGELPSSDALMLEDPEAQVALRMLYHSSHFERLQNLRSVYKKAEVIPLFDRLYVLTLLHEGGSAHGRSWAAFLAALVLGFGFTEFRRTRRNSKVLERKIKQLGQYHIERKIASGGMGSVYRAHHVLLRRPTAIKIAHQKSSARHFEQEILLTSALSHPNTVQVYDFGRGADGQFYCAMELVEGFNLDQLVRTAGALPVGRAGRILSQVSASLGEAHEKGVLHRDVKPNNIMVTERGGLFDFVKVLDFGLAKLQDKGLLSFSTSQSQEGTFAGTPGFLAPEVVTGARPSPASDMFSLGCVAYFLLTGRAPFSARSAAEALRLVLVHDPPPIDDVPAALRTLIRDCLEKTPEKRPKSMRIFGDRLRFALKECEPWTTSQAEDWWVQNPPEAPIPSTTRSFSFRLRRVESTDVGSTDVSSGTR